LADFIVKAYQYQIMGINADGSALENFNPNWLVTRAEFATVFSRVLYWDKYNQAEWNYYEKHLSALKGAGILSNDAPTIQEVRGWVMLMMYRSANEKAQTQEEPKTEEWTGNIVWIANPASVYCVEQEWEIEIREETDGSQYGVCKFKDGTEVEEWEYFRANHKDETSTWAVAGATTWATAEILTGSITGSN
jgi:putative hemolysin